MGSHNWRGFPGSFWRPFSPPRIPQEKALVFQGFLHFIYGDPPRRRIERTAA